MRRQSIIAAAVTIAVLGLAACSQSEPPPGAPKAVRYQGKPDERPWDSPEWGGDQAKWERAIQTRAMNQNEYTRTQ